MVPRLLGQFAINIIKIIPIFIDRAILTFEKKLF